MKLMLKSRFRLLLSFILSAIILTGLLFGPEIKAAALMTYWNHVQKQDSLLSDCGLSISIPGGSSTIERDWFPIVMNFNADQAFSTYMNEPGLRLTVLYNFPAFSIKDRCSRLYDPASPYYNSFYGAYIVRSASDTPFGFANDTPFGIETSNPAESSVRKLTINPQDLAVVPCFDYKKLVLEDFGLAGKDFIFDWRITEETEGVTYAGLEGWVSLKADLKVSGAVHQAKDHVFSYMQYGTPHKYRAEDFSPALMKGQIYARYFPEYDVSVFFYIVASDQSVLENCDKRILSKSRIR